MRTILLTGLMNMILVSMLSCSGFSTANNNLHPQRFLTTAQDTEHFLSRTGISFKQVCNTQVQAAHIKSIVVLWIQFQHDQRVHITFRYDPDYAHESINPILLTSHRPRTSAEPFIS